MKRETRKAEELRAGRTSGRTAERTRQKRVRRNERRKRAVAWARAHRKGLRRIRLVSFHILSIAIVAGICALGLTRNAAACLRFWEGLRDIANLFGKPTVTYLPNGMVEGFPRAVEELTAIAKTFAASFFSKENFLAYLSLLGEILRVVCYGISFGLFPVIVVWMLLRQSAQKIDLRHGRKSAPLRAFLSFREHGYLPVKAYLRDFIKFFRRQKKYFVSSILIALFFLNAYTIILEFFAFYFAFLFYDAGIGTQVVKLCYDLFLAFRFLPAFVWAGVGLWIFCKIRKEIGYRLLESHEQKMRDFLDGRGVNILICGPPRTGKTTLLVSVAKSLMAKARNNAHAGMRDLERKFPDFPWIVLEMMIKKAYGRRRIRNLYHVREWVKKIAAMSKDNDAKQAFLKYLKREYGSCCAVPFEFPFFNYDTDHFATVYNGGLGEETVEDAVLDYAQLYLIYINPTLIISNFSIRSDHDLIDYGNFPMWRDDFFRHDPDPVTESQFSHIFNQDLVRPGKQVDPECPYVNSFEYGFLIETEVGKERGNQFDRAGISRNSPDANIVNDLRDNEFKLMGHKGTIYNIPFAGYVGDEQRPESWCANARELCDIVTIRERCRDKILLPFFVFEQLLYLLVKSLFGKYYDTIRANRGDTTLLTYLLFHTCKPIFDHYDRVNNRFGGHFLKVDVESGMRREGDSDLSPKKTKLFIANAKVYANVFRTDAWKGVMEHRAQRSAAGLDDVPVFKDVEASLDEFREMRSYFFEELIKVYGGDERKKEEALALLMTTLELFRKDSANYGDQISCKLLAEFAASLPSLVKKDEKIDQLKERLYRKRDELLGKGKDEMEKEKKRKAAEAAKKDKTEEEKRKDNTKEARAAEK